MHYQRYRGWTTQSNQTLSNLSTLGYIIIAPLITSRIAIPRQAAVQTLDYKRPRFIHDVSYCNTQTSNAVYIPREQFIDYSQCTCMYMHVHVCCMQMRGINAWKISCKNLHSRSDSSRSTHAQHFSRICGTMRFGRVSMASDRSEER